MQDRISPTAIVRSLIRSPHRALQVARRAVTQAVTAVPQRWATHSGRTPLHLDRIATHPEYVRYLETYADAIGTRQALERKLIKSSTEFSLGGWCYVCAMPVLLTVGFAPQFEESPNWREHLMCPGCRLNNRMRAAVHIFEQGCQPAPQDRIYVTEQTTPMFAALGRRYPHLTGSEYLSDAVPFGEVSAAGIRNESVCRLTFETSAFEHILSFDVLEHVPQYRQALAEFYRCLRPGGWLVLSVPFTGEARTLTRALLQDDGSVRHLVTPEYHGDPLSTAGCLCFYHFGWDLLETMREIGFQNVQSVAYWSRDYGYLGEGRQLLLLAQKPRT